METHKIPKTLRKPKTSSMKRRIQSGEKSHKIPQTTNLYSLMRKMLTKH